MVSGGLLRGLSHDLNGRVTALHAVSVALENGEADHALETLEQEAGRLETLARRLAALADTYADAEAVAIDRILDDALALARLDRDLEPLEMSCRMDDGVPPALVPRAVFLRSLLAVLTGLGRSARRNGAHALAVAVRADDDHILLTATLEAPAGEAAAVQGFRDAPMFDVLVAVAEAFHGTLHAHPADAPRVELRVPSIHAPHRPPLDI